ncbi:MAG TPA: hypothetical protein VMV66_02470 [Candidatus Humimicrobiaceae bacterium]|nr:hypothetical protein [Candidatus Humimicrobiaceae bacterium]
MKRSYLIIVIAIATLILAGIIVEFFLQKQEILPPLEVFLPEQKFHSYLELPSLSGKFLEFDEAKSEITILYFNTETMKVNQKTFKTDKETIFSKATFNLYQPDLFLEEELKKVKQETQTTVFYLSAENGILLARLIQVETSF